MQPLGEPECEPASHTDALCPGSARQPGPSLTTRAALADRFAEPNGRLAALLARTGLGSDADWRWEE